MAMEIAELTALMEAGTIHSFRSTFGQQPVGARGRVVKVSALLDPDVVWVRTLSGTIHRWHRQNMSVL